MPPNPKEPARKRAVADVLTDPDAFATTLVTMVHDTYGADAYTWHPETLALELRDDYGVALPRASFDRLMAGLAIASGDEFFRSLPDFAQLCPVLSGEPYRPDLIDPPDAAECAWGITEALLLNPPDDGDDEGPFAPEIAAYVGRVLDREGIADAPDVLRIGRRDGPPPAPGGAGDDAAREIAALIRHNLARLLGQLAQLPLAHGDAAGLAGRLARNL
jgi:hypothetical protein